MSGAINGSGAYGNGGGGGSGGEANGRANGQAAGAGAYAGSGRGGPLAAMRGSAGPAPAAGAAALRASARQQLLRPAWRRPPPQLQRAAVRPAGLAAAAAARLPL